MYIRSTVIFYHLSLVDLVDRSEQQHEVLPSYYYDMYIWVACACYYAVEALLRLLYLVVSPAWKISLTRITTSSP